MKPSRLSWRAATQLLFFALLLWGFTGCSTFHRDWRRAAATPVPGNDISGRWDGRWQSEANRHQGRLRCLVAKLETGQYQARFHANYWKVLSFGYSVPLNAQENSGIFHFEGAADLGHLAGGKYTYKGQASPTNFFSTYRADGDHGTFRMTRP